MTIPVDVAASMVKHAAGKKREWDKTVADAYAHLDAAIVARTHAEQATAQARGELWQAVYADDAIPADEKEATVAKLIEEATQAPTFSSI